MFVFTSALQLAPLFASHEGGTALLFKDMPFDGLAGTLAVCDEKGTIVPLEFDCTSVEFDLPSCFWLGRMREDVITCVNVDNVDDDGAVVSVGEASLGSEKEKPVR